MAGTSFNVAKDKPIVLRLTLPEVDNTKFVKAVVRDQNGTQLLGSPFTLTNLGDGRYFFKDEINLKFPISAIEISAMYLVYDDVGFTIPTADYSFQNEDVFRVGDDEDIEGTLQSLTASINNMLTMVPTIEAELEFDDEPIEAEIEINDEPITAEIEE